MNKKMLLIFFLAIIALGGCSKFFGLSPYSAFNHEEHVDVLFEQRRDCFYCHQLPDIDTFIEAADQIQIDAELKIDGKCHTCHKAPETKIPDAPAECTLCHDNLKVMKPDDHVAQWDTLHAVPAALSEASCQECHRDWYCQNCHTEQNTIEYARHSRSFRLVHSIEAAIDPASCDSCHRTSFCIDCHRRN